MPVLAADLDGSLGAAIGVGKPQRSVVRQVASPPLEHRPHDWHEIAARVGEHIFVTAALARFLVRPALQQAGVHQFVQSRRRRGLGHPDPTPEILEPGGAVERLPHDQHRRLGAQQCHGLLDRALSHRRPAVAVGEPPLQNCHVGHSSPGLFSLYLGVIAEYREHYSASSHQEARMAGYAGRDAVIVGAVRTPVGKGKANGALHGVLPVDLLAHSLRELVERTGIDPASVDDVIAGAVTQVGDQAVNIARNAVLGAGFPETVPGTTIDRQCGSSQQAISFAAQGVIAGSYDIVIASGVESMSRVTMGSSVLPGSDPFGLVMADRYPEGLVPQGISAELIAAKWQLSRTELDEFSAGSHEKAARATKEGLFDNELVPIAGLSTDEIIRPGTTVETLAG